MQTIKVPDKLKASSTAAIPYVESRIPAPEEFVVLSQTLLNATAKTGKELKDCVNSWALGGDAGELLFGVNIRPDHLTILTTKEGCDEISKKLVAYQVKKNSPEVVERELERTALMAANSYHVRIKSYFAEFSIDGTRLDVHGDLQIKVADWEWGDALEFEPETANIVGVTMPVVPLRLKKELYIGLGWTDRVKKINDALVRSHHRNGLTASR
ncbi:MAG: hypothetical protein ACREBS_08965 [Nitrososphaerales archaeon]